MADQEILEVEKVDFEALVNSVDHHTEYYDLLLEETKPMLRRGQIFKMEVFCKRDFNDATDIIRLSFSFGDKPRQAKGTKAVFRVATKASEELTPSDWGARSRIISGKKISFNVMIAADCPVGYWKLEIITKHQNDPKKKKIFSANESVIVLFNAWSKADAVYMENDEERGEYVLNDVGKIWCGTMKRLRERAWNFGQFEDVVVLAAIKLLNVSKLNDAARGDPVKVVRTITAMVNSEDEGGILQGNWTGEYDDGVPPSNWQGSVEILQQWYETGNVVRYGQCWVFSGVATTVMRALGIPARSVTNYSSAHDTNSNITIDVHYDDDYSMIDELNDDSIWNFHVWNECWMTRPDLPAGYGGWQVVDATPQETSEGIYRAGPASVAAIRKGEVNHLFDAPFIFAEVNADIIHWKYENDDEDLLQLQTDPDVVGQMISTKKPGPVEKGKDDRVDITNLYKDVEKTDAERQAVLNALKCGHSTSRFAYKQPNADVRFALEDKDDVHIGKPFSHQLSLWNESGSERNVAITMRLATTYYTGRISKKIKEEKLKVKLKPQKDDVVKFSVTPEEYFDALVDQASFELSVCCKVLETEQYFCKSDDFRLRAPDVIVKASGSFQAGKPFKVTFSFENPLPSTLHQCHFTIEGPGIHKPKKIPCKDVEGNETVTMSYECNAKRPGKKVILVSFASKQLDDADGYTNIVVVQ